MLFSQMRLKRPGAEKVKRESSKYATSQTAGVGTKQHDKARLASAALKYRQRRLNYEDQSFLRSRRDE